MSCDNPALTRLVTANIIGSLAARYAADNGMSLADSLQYTMNSKLYQQLVDPTTALYNESIAILYEQLTSG
jgi:hypothetical protein